MLTTEHQRGFPGSPRQHLLALLAGMLAGQLLFALLLQWNRNWAPQSAALGANTVVVSGEFDGQMISRPEFSAAVVASMRLWQSQGHQVAMILGASQVHAINARQAGDQPAVVYANRAAVAHGVGHRYVQISYPNANLNEMLATYLILRHQHALPDHLLLALVYDDLREPNVRDSIMALLPPLDDSVLAAGGAGVAGLQHLCAGWQPPQSDPTEGTLTELSLQQRSETATTAMLTSLWPAFAGRHNLYARLEFELMRGWAKVRAALLALLAGGGALYRAPEPPLDLRQWNEAALASLLALAARDHVAITLYWAPHPTCSGPYYHDRAAYLAWKEAKRLQATAVGAEFVDLEHIVPLQYWGTNNSGYLDVFHFSDAAHRLLGAALFDAEQAGDKR